MPPNTDIAICICWRSFKKCSQANIDSVSHARAKRPLLLQLLAKKKENVGKCQPCLATMVYRVSGPVWVRWFSDAFTSFFHPIAPPLTNQLEWVGVATLRQTSIDVLNVLCYTKQF